jgi:hypothetical protein
MTDSDTCRAGRRWPSWAALILAALAACGLYELVLTEPVKWNKWPQIEKGMTQDAVESIMGAASADVIASSTMALSPSEMGAERVARWYRRGRRGVVLVGINKSGMVEWVQFREDARVRHAPFWEFSQ